MDVYTLSEAILKGGLRSTNFFNGRLLSAEALSNDQQANREGRRRLGRAIGSGIVWGLETSVPQGSPPADGAEITVSAGLALNRNGDALSLANNTSVKLTAVAQEVQTNAGLFQVCTQDRASATVTETGLYLLTLAPASSFSDYAPTSGLIGVGQGGAGCGRSYAVEGVQFNRVPLSRDDLSGGPLASQIIDLLDNTDLPSLSRLRNLLAQLCFGGVAQADLARDPFTQVAQPVNDTLVDALYSRQALSDCAVPLALLHWQGQAITFVDHLALRQRLTAPVANPGWEFLIGDRRRSQAEAALLQFQAHLAEIRTSATSLSTLRARDWFAFLPPVGFVPVGSSLAFSAQSFFAGLSVRRTGAAADAPIKPSFLPVAQIEPLTRAALAYPPIDLGSQEFIRVYQVSTATIDTPQQPYLIFTSGYMPDISEPIVNLARFNAAHAARGCDL